jgi:lipopolysaccharide transport system permease protein
MVGVIDGFRWAILGEAMKVYMPGFVISLLVNVAILIVGVGYFRRTERKFADII